MHLLLIKSCLVMVEHFALESLDLQTELGALSVAISPDFVDDGNVFVGVSRF